MSKISVLGPKGTFSDMAARKLEYDIIYHPSHEDVILSLKNNEAKFALLAFENQLSGTILENLDLMIKNDLKIIKEIVLPIHHNLCAMDTAKPVKKIFSHPQGFLQCRNFLGRKYELIEMKSTADSFEHIKKNHLADAACIGTKLACEIYGFKILDENIEDFHHNETRFFVISKNESEEKGKKASIIFKVKHEPGSLVNSLQRPAKHDINLTKIESRPIPERPWEYMFYCDLECENHEKMKKAIDEMEVSLAFLKRLGTYDVVKM
ncbi:MAG: prephenate dehydratase [Candidatus Woesearchaeota archaeon]|nr:prephenate dehydratase [Candidatus Woesearchaeota archaeon]